MIQPYFKPDVNPNLPAFAVFYNEFYKERSAMNMQLMKMALEQASPEYLGKMIDRTQSNIEDLRKLKANIMESEARSASKSANDYMRYQMQALTKTAELNFRGQEDLFGAVYGGVSKASKAKSDLKRYERDLGNAQQKYEVALKDDPIGNSENIENWAADNGLKTNDLALLTDSGRITDQIMVNKIKGKFEDLPSKNVESYLQEQYPNLPENRSEEEIEEMKTKPLEDLGFMLSPEEKEEANKYIKMVDGQPQLRENVPEDKKEMVQKEITNRIATKKIGVGVPKRSTSSANFKTELDKIDAEITSEAAKLQGLYTRYGIQQQQGIDRIFDPFESNYRTENLFQRKSPRVQRVEQQIQDYQYRDMSGKPEGYSNIEYNKEYEAPGGLYFGLTKVGDQDTPYIFEDGVPFEIPAGEPEYNTIIELLKEQDRKLGGL